MEIEFLGRKKKPVCDKVIVFSENGRKCKKCVVSTRFYSESI